MPYSTKEQKDEHNRKNYLKHKKRILLERKLAYIEERAVKPETIAQKDKILKRLEKYK